MSSTIGEARQVRIETQPSVAVAQRRRWPESTPPPVLLRRTIDEVAREIVIARRPFSTRAAKRALDIVGSLLGLLLLAPIFLIVAVVVRFSSNGPAFFVQERCGLGGRKFRFYKFRTMVVDAERRKAELAHLNEMRGPAFKIARDPRVTRLGALLRRSSIDELPQLWNVLKGDMSLVGPRPPVPDEVERYTTKQAQRLSVMPGITGLWQVSGRNAIEDFERWVELDLEYVRRSSTLLDLRILMQTVVVVLLARGAQ